MRKLILIFMIVFLLVGACTAAVVSQMPDPSSSSAGNLDPAQNKYSPDAATGKPAPAGIEDGTWEVGTDVKAGKYKSAGGEACYWERQSGAEGFDDIIENSASPGPQVVTIKSSDYAFKTQGCATWIRQKR